MSLQKFKYKNYDYPGIYRGTVVYNVDPDVKGKLKIFVHGVYPDEYFDKHQYLPWAEPAMSLFGGNWTNEKPDFYGNHLNDQTGWCTVPHQGIEAATGSQVYVFFENSDINKPVYFAAAQSSEGWFSEHPNQHVFKTDNVTVRIDQNTKHEDSTCKFDTYNDKNNLMSIHDGTKKDVETRVDIQVMAKDINAVNLQISGNVNMKILGDWYIHHEGDQHYTHIGNTYAKHVGNTYFEQEGDYTFRHVGNVYSEYIEAEKILNVVGNVYKTVTGNEQKNIFENYDTKVGANYDRYIKGDSHYTVVGNDVREDNQDCTVKIAGNTDIMIGKNLDAVIGNEGQNKPGNATVTVAHDIVVQSVKGNMDFNTLGQFELFNSDAVITAQGYNNIGTKGNIRLTSTLGNIALQTVNNPDMDPNLTDQSTVLPWNPVFLSNVSLISMIFKDFDPKKALFMNLSSILNISSITALINFLTTLPTTIIYDGLPTFFPCRMINQNPNSKPVDQATWVAGQYKNYKNQEEDWQKVTNLAYWKVLGRMIGNIDINSWSGDINIKTHGQLGNAGNINIEANDQIGSLATNTRGTGNVNIKNQTKYRVYTDPRNMFLDSQSIFNRISILSNGSGDPSLIMNCIPVANTKNTAGGCASCMADTLLDLIKSLGLLAPEDEKNVGVHLHPIRGTKPMPHTFYDHDVKTDLDKSLENINISEIVLQITKVCGKYVTAPPTSVYSIPNTIQDFKTNVRKILKKSNLPKYIISKIMLSIENALPEITIDPSDLTAPAKYASLMLDLPENIGQIISSISTIIEKYSEKEDPLYDGCALSLFKGKTNGMGHAIDNNITDINFKNNFGSINIKSTGPIHQYAENDFTINADMSYPQKYTKNISITPYLGYEGIKVGMSWSPVTMIPAIGQVYPSDGLKVTTLGYQINNTETFGDEFKYQFNYDKINKVIVRNKILLYGVPISLTTESIDNTIIIKDKYKIDTKYGDYIYNINSQSNKNFGTVPIPLYLDDESQNPIIQIGGYMNPYNIEGNDGWSGFTTINSLLQEFNNSSETKNGKIIVNNTSDIVIADMINGMVQNKTINVTLDQNLNPPKVNNITWPHIGQNSNLFGSYELLDLTDPEAPIPLQQAIGGFVETITTNKFGKYIQNIDTINGTVPSEILPPDMITQTKDINGIITKQTETTIGSALLYQDILNQGIMGEGHINKTNDITNGILSTVNKGGTIDYVDTAQTVINQTYNAKTHNINLNSGNTNIMSKVTQWTVSLLSFLKG